MQTVTLTPDRFAGAVSVEEGDGYLKPWRVPFADRRLFPSINDGLLGRAAWAAGVRLRFRSDTTTIRLTFLPLGEVNPATGRTGFVFDATIDGKLVASGQAPSGGEDVTIAGLPAGEKTLELWLPQDTPVALESLEVDDGATCTVVPDHRPVWVTYGSSLTHCVRAHSPARTWPAILARRHGLNLICLGFGGECHLEAMFGRLIRDLEADYVSLKLGINAYGNGSVNRRTYGPAAIALVQLIRERHPNAPLALISPMAYPPGETNVNGAGISIEQMREDLADAAARLIEHGDSRLIYVDGLNVFSLEELAVHSTDQCHPGADGIELMAENVDRSVMQPLLAMG